MAVSAENTHWRDSARDVKFFILDGKTAFPMLLFLVYMRVSTFIIAVCATLFFTVLHRFGFSTTVFFRLVRAFIAGKRKIAIPWWDR